MGRTTDTTDRKCTTQFGIFGAGDMARAPVSGRTPTEHMRIKALVEYAKLAEDVGLDV